MHSSASLRVGPMLMRLCAAAGTSTSVSGPPFILVGHQRYTLYEAEALIDALVQLVDSGLEVTPREGA
ncbi:hypothetical protein FBY26_1336 [Phycicoccus sp. SLBN-51]|nr:hypothetical protein FBY26_1336 [Phycicoccus sp. SLBN-51]